MDGSAAAEEVLSEVRFPWFVSSLGGGSEFSLMPPCVSSSLALGADEVCWSVEEVEVSDWFEVSSDWDGFDSVDD